MTSDYHTLPLAPERWSDLERLFGDKGARSGCWCMRWRHPPVEFERGRGADNRRALREGVERGQVQGVLAYLEQQPVAWCSLGPREDFVGLSISEVLAPVDKEAVWSVSCFYVKPAHRRRGLTRLLLLGAVELARDRGLRFLEAYPLVPREQKIPVGFAWTGFARSFETTGFVEVARRVELRPVVRFDLEKQSPGAGETPAQN